MKLILLISILTLGHFVRGQLGMGTIQGILVDGDGELIPFGKVIVYSGDRSNSTVVAGAQSDFDGKIRINAIAPGRYTLEITNLVEGVDTLHLDGVEVYADVITSLGKIEMTRMEIICCFGIPDESLYQLQMDPFGRSITIESEDIIRP